MFNFRNPPLTRENNDEIRPHAEIEGIMHVTSWNCYLFYRRDKVLRDVHSDSSIDKLVVCDGFLWHWL